VILAVLMPQIEVLFLDAIINGVILTPQGDNMRFYCRCGRKLIQARICKPCKRAK
jgi:hypothetical protein